MSQTMETEEDLLTCLHVKLYHPQQTFRGFYHQLPLSNRRQHQADEPLRLGRDAQACTFTLADPKVSRKQLAFHAYRTPQDPGMLFTVQNLSQKGRMMVNRSALGYLERMDLPDKALIEFGGFEMLVVREPGEAKMSYEVEFHVLEVPPSTETGIAPQSITPVMETGSCNSSAYSLPGELACHGPLETDETLMA
ncbi:TRAF-interacting protein with FHA domain-containing protein A [Lampris incognitus]|uniref:TRAF-interacting protein with FHA domain-containing protein A n=1 Tax=Lampris incognitus TaxID=2546036 RepID=UPI0024B52C3C|nr:TRAF-interacting protein with FHA domain-containing protein A [Lampris incognitus]